AAGVPEGRGRRGVASGNAAASAAWDSSSECQRRPSSRRPLCQHSPRGAAAPCNPAAGFAFTGSGESPQERERNLNLTSFGPSDSLSGIPTNRDAPSSSSGCVSRRLFAPASTQEVSESRNAPGTSFNSKLISSVPLNAVRVLVHL